MAFMEDLEKLASHDGPELEGWAIHESRYAGLNGASGAAALLMRLGEECGQAIYGAALADDDGRRRSG